MTTENGQKIQGAIKAVCQMHRDVSKLLLDFDDFAPWPCDPVFGNNATRDLTTQARTKYWMCEGVYRYLSSKTHPGLVEAITVCFLEPNLIEPLLLLGRIQYEIAEGATVAGTCEPWDLWYLYFKNENWQSRCPRNCPTPDASRIKTAWVVATPLYSIGSLAEVGDLLVALRSAGAGS
jgi:hypothetical protein